MSLNRYFDAAIMLTWSDWKTEPRSNRYHYATRLARHLPVYFVQADEPAGSYIEPTEIENIKLVHAGCDYSSLQSERLDQIFQRLKIRKPLLWIYNSYFEDFIARHQKHFKIYHATENLFMEESIRPPDFSRLRASLKNVLAETDLLVAVCESVQESFCHEGGYRGPSLLLRNGCDFAFWQAKRAHEFAPGGNGRSIAFFQGGINNRLDYTLLAALIRNMPDWDFWFAGHATAAPLWQLLIKLENVRYWGALDVDQIAVLSRQATIGLIPFKDRPHLRTSLPLKSFEYIASGLPVVTTPIDELSARPDLFTTAVSAEDFEKAMRALAPSRNQPAAIALRLKAAGEASYDLRFNELVKTAMEIQRSRTPGVYRWLSAPKLLFRRLARFIA